MNADRKSEAVLITGCSSGIGRATAGHLAQRGYTVYASARKLDAIRDLEAHGCQLLALDVTDDDSMSAGAEAVEREQGAVRVLVNKASQRQSGTVESIPMHYLYKLFETNVF